MRRFRLALLAGLLGCGSAQRPLAAPAAKAPEVTPNDEPIPDPPRLPAVPLDGASREPIAGPSDCDWVQVKCPMGWVSLPRGAACPVELTGRITSKRGRGRGQTTITIDKGSDDGVNERWTGSFMAAWGNEYRVEVFNVRSGTSQAVLPMLERELDHPQITLRSPWPGLPDHCSLH